MLRYRHDGRLVMRVMFLGDYKYNRLEKEKDTFFLKCNKVFEKDGRLTAAHFGELYLRFERDSYKEFYAELFQEYEALHEKDCDAMGLNYARSIVTENGSFLCKTPTPRGGDELCRPDDQVVHVNGLTIEVSYFHDGSPCSVKLLED